MNFMKSDSYFLLEFNLTMMCKITKIQKVKINKNKTFKQKKTNLKHTKYTKIEQINKNQLFKQRKIRIKTIQNKQKIVRANNVKNRTVRVFFKPHTKQSAIMISPRKSRHLKGGFLRMEWERRNNTC